MIRVNKSIKGQSLRSELPLTKEEMWEIAPSIFATHAHESRSDRYGFVSTWEVLEALREETGLQPFFVAQAGSRSDGKYNHARHMVRLRQANEIGNSSANEVIIHNDSAGGGAYGTTMGYLNGACMNGCVFGEGISTVKIRHNAKAIENVIEGVYSVVNQTDKVNDSVEAMKSIRLSRMEQLEFAATSLQLRYDDGKAPIEPRQIIVPWRAEEEEPTLWNTFQMTQEKLIRGGVKGRVTNPETRQRRRTTTRPVNSIGDNFELNRQLWTLADCVAAMKQGRSIQVAA
mgnify:FL=1